MNINIVGNATVDVTAEIGGVSPNAVLKEIYQPSGVYTMECDTNALTILATRVVPELTVDYNLTMTYPQ